MTKQQQEYMNKIEATRTEGRELFTAGKKVEAKAKAEEVKNLEGELRVILDLESKTPPNPGQSLEVIKTVEDKQKAYKSAFLKAFRNKANKQDYEILNALDTNIGTGVDGGLLLPQDIQTKINRFKVSLPMLESLINIIPVGMIAGSRVFETIATMTPFANITDETADIEDMGNPNFQAITYAIKDYAGYLPIPNDLIQDSDQAIEQYLVTWIARKSVVTRNSLILGILNTLSKVLFADWKAIKKAINISLDPMLALGATIVTNQDGYQYLDTLVDTMGRPLLQPDLTNLGAVRLFGKSVVIIPNTILLTTGTTTKLAPMIVGNLNELMTMFERVGHQILSTNIGGTAFRKNRTEMRAIEREDVKLIDVRAAIYGTIDVTAVV